MSPGGNPLIASINTGTPLRGTALTVQATTKVSSGIPNCAQVFGFAFVEFRPMALVNGHRNIPPQAKPGHAELQQVLPNRVTDADDSVESRIQQVQPGLRAPVSEVPNDAAIGDELDIDADRRHQAIHRRTLVEHVQHVVLFALAALRV